MHFTLAFLATALAIFAAATPSPRGESASGCATGSTVQCCQTVQTPEQAGADVTTVRLLALIGTDATTLSEVVDGVVGLTCSVPGSTGTCTDAPLCCTTSGLNGLVTTGCIPTTL